ncbi:hypothetical protein PHMEG_00017577 [Phytophthora megakarya]|uniref:Uncharacterized protein n=1 Tax=Phytophthora megakarya TaxID=4795 RepID=A0A225VVZ2_9STRA|nr:hypothetical protein PHMEG_00017577 [Phytophthora megakarya]
MTKEAMACVLLDPRTKASAKKVCAVGNISRKEEKVIYKNDEHRKVFTQMTKLGKIQLSSQSSLLSQDLNSPTSSPSSTGWDGEDDLLLRAPIRATKTRDEVKASEIRDEVKESEISARADCIMREWIDVKPEWLEVA